jgi:hypothetical protein
MGRASERIFWEILVIEPDGTPHVGHAILSEQAEPAHIIGIIARVAEMLTEHAVWGLGLTADRQTNEREDLLMNGRRFIPRAE